MHANETLRLLENGSKTRRARRPAPTWTRRPGVPRLVTDEQDRSAATSHADIDVQGMPWAFFQL